MAKCFFGIGLCGFALALIQAHTHLQMENKWRHAVMEWRGKETVFWLRIHLPIFYCRRTFKFAQMLLRGLFHLRSFSRTKKGKLVGRSSPSQDYYQCLGTQWPCGDPVVTEFDGQLECVSLPPSFWGAVICGPWQQRLQGQKSHQLNGFPPFSSPHVSESGYGRNTPSSWDVVCAHG